MGEAGWVRLSVESFDQPVATFLLNMYGIDDVGTVYERYKVQTAGDGTLARAEWEAAVNRGDQMIEIPFGEDEQGRHRLHLEHRVLQQRVQRHLHFARRQLRFALRYWPRSRYSSARSWSRTAMSMASSTDPPV